MTISASDLYDLVECPKRFELDTFGDAETRDPDNAFVKLLWERGALFERETIAKLESSFEDLSHLESGERERATLNAMRSGVQLIYGGRIAVADLVGMPDLLRKEVGGYVPGDIKSGRGKSSGGDDSEGKPKLHYAVQLGLYIDVLEKLNFSAGRRAFVWDVRGKEVIYDFTVPQGKIKKETLWEEYEWALAEARAILAQEQTPLAAYSAACKLCHWHTFCLAQLEKDDDLTLIPFLGRAARDVMHQTIRTIADLAECNPASYIDKKDKTPFPRVGGKSLQIFQKRAALLKDPNAKPYLRDVVKLSVAPVEISFDIEFDPMRDICYLHGVIERRNGDDLVEFFHPFFAADITPEAEKRAFANAMSYFNDRPDAVIYYYSPYERTAYRKLQKKYSDVCSEDDIERLFAEGRAVDLYTSIVRRATEWPTRDHSIKTLAKYLGFSWRDSDPSGAASIEWFDQWARGRDEAVKNRIIAYNEDDCRATFVLLDGIRQLA